MTNTKVKIYYNLHKKCLSIMANEGDKKGLVIGYADSVSLVDATFKVSAAGRKRVLDQKRKNVHAFIYGTMTDTEAGVLDTAVTYNPYKYSSFVNKADETPVTSALMVVICGRSILIG